MARGRWRPLAEQVVREVIAEYPGYDERELRRLISDEYPFGRREHWPYAVWLDVVAKEVAAWKRRTLPIAGEPDEGLFAKGGRP